MVSLLFRGEAARRHCRDARLAGSHRPHQETAVTWSRSWVTPRARGAMSAFLRVWHRQGGAEIGVSPPAIRSMRGYRRRFSWARGGRARARSGPVMVDGVAMLPTVIAVARAEMRSEFLSFILMIHFVA